MTLLIGSVTAESGSISIMKRLHWLAGGSFRDRLSMLFRRSTCTHTLPPPLPNARPFLFGNDVLIAFD